MPAELYQPPCGDFLPPRRSRRNPEDDTPRLILADWLEEHGDSRGEFIRLQCRGPPSQERRAAPSLPAQAGRPAAREAPRVLAGTAVAAEAHTRCNSAEVWFTRLHKAVVPRRLPVRAQDWIEAWGWVEEVNLTDIHKSPDVFEKPIARQITALNLSHNDLADAGVEALARSPHLEGLLSLSLYFTQIRPEGAREHWPVRLHSTGLRARPRAGTRLGKREPGRWRVRRLSRTCRLWTCNTPGSGLEASVSWRRPLSVS